jgi:hypothetical protein
VQDARLQRALQTDRRSVRPVRFRVAGHTFRRKTSTMPTLTRTRGRRVLALTATFGALALGASACGSSSDTDPDPAQAVPASAPIYIQATIKPDGDLQADTESVLKKLGVDDPAADITAFLKDAADDPASVDDVKEWVGSRVGVFVTSFTGDTDAAAVIATTDPGKAADSIDKDGAKKGSYKDVDYWFDQDDPGSVQGVVDDYAVSGSERAFRTVVDTVKGDDVETIADNSQYQAGLQAVGSDNALATAYVSTEGVLNAIGRSGGIPAAQLGQIRQQLSQVGGKTTVVKVAPSSDSITLEVATLGLKEGEATSDAATTALTSLPGDAWLGVGLPHIGESLRSALQQGLQLGSVTGQDLSGQLRAIQQAIGIDIEQDLLSWMGDGGLFAGGAAANIGGALVVQTTDAAKAQQAVRKLAKLVPQIADGVQVRQASVAGADEAVEFRADGFPFPIVAAVGNDRFVLGVGDKAVEQGLSPTTTLADSPSFKTAAQALGDVKPAFFLDVSAVGSLLGALVPATDPDTQQVMSALQKVSTIAAGTQRDGSTQRTKIIVTLK